MSKPHRCHRCGHPGGWHRRVTNSKRACSCECHKVPDKPAPLPPEPKPEHPKPLKPRNRVAQKKGGH
jgi:hypothetical protein